MGRDDSWPASVPSVVPSLGYTLSEKAIQIKHPKWRNRTSDREFMADYASGSLDPIRVS